MGFFGALNSLLDENSDKSFEKRITGAIDRVEHALDKGVDKVDATARKAEFATEKVTEIVDKTNQPADEQKPEI